LFLPSSTAPLYCRKPAPSRISNDSCCAKENDKRDILYFKYHMALMAYIAKMITLQMVTLHNQKLIFCVCYEKMFVKYEAIPVLA
jgi:hypothetical protein